MEGRVGRDGEAKKWGKNDTPASAKSYHLRVTKQELAGAGPARLQELHTLAHCLDHLALGRTGACADVLAQRLKAVELSVGVGWDRARRIELVPADATSLVDREEEMATARDQDFDRRLAQVQYQRWNRWSNDGWARAPA